MIIRKYLLTLAWVISLGTLRADFLGVQVPQTGFVFGGSVDVRKTQLVELEKGLDQFKKRYDESKKKSASELNKISSELNETQQNLNEASGQGADLLNKKITILHDRRQNLAELQDLWKESLQYLELHTKLLNEIIDFIQISRPSPKLAYGWKELREAQIRAVEMGIKIDALKEKRENIKKQRVAVQERLSSLERQIEVKQKEQDKINAQRESSEKGAYLDSAILKLDGDILINELAAIQEKILKFKLLIEKLDIEGKYRDDVIELEQNKLNEQRLLLDQIEGRLVLDYNDVEIAKNEWKSEVQNTLNLKEKINQICEPKKLTREKLSLDLDVLKQRLKDLKTKGVKDRVVYMQLKAQYQRLSALLMALNQEIMLLDAERDLAEMHPADKELQFNMVELRYKLKLEVENIDVLLATFQNKRELAVSSLKALHDQQKEASTSLVETKRAKEKVTKSKNKILHKASLQPKNKRHVYAVIMGLLDETQQFLNMHVGFTESFIAVNADLITQQQRIVNQYDLIIKELEKIRRMYGVWRRSPQAISLEALGRSLLEAESFFKKLYWETPTRLNIVTVFRAVRSWPLFNYILIILFFVMYLLSFIAVRIGLMIMRQRLQAIVDRYQGYARYIYLHIILAMINFALEYFVLLFTWFFIFLHVVTNFKYLFATLSPIANPYTITVFYLLSIPLLLYLSHHFVGAFKDLNKKLSYVFFAETFQDKFILLISVFCYATSVLLPLRLAILAYADIGQSEFATVILAAYSLTIIVVALLFFSKEDVLRLVPSHTTFFIWLKRKIDKHYYPVFLFFMFLLVLSNPYIGYSNMAWFLAFAVPSTVFLMYLLFAVHYYIRKYALFIFMKEEDEEIIDKFEHAKTYYGFFVIFLFLVLIFAASIIALRIWGFDYNPSDLWKVLSEQWVVRVGVNKFGFVELMTLGLFITGSFLLSSLVHKFILSRLFDILRSEPGIQNTISRIFHYVIVFLAIVMGLYAIHLGDFISWAWLSFSIVFGLAIKDIVMDFVAGFFVLLERPIEIGNYIQIDETQGTVHKIAARSTTIITSRNHSIIIPNKDLITKWIINWGHGRFAVGFELNIRVDLRSDPDLVKKVLVTTIQSNPLILKVPGIVARLEDIEENGLYFLVRAFISARRVKEQWELAALLRSEIIKAFRENNIVLAKPARLIEMESGVVTQGPKAIEIKFDK